MEKRELYDKFEELSQNLMSMLAEVEAIKANFSGILDENTALKLENDKLREHLSQVVQEETGTKMSHGKVNLEAIYDDGFHICPDFMANVVIIMKLVASVQNCCTETKYAGSKEF